MDNFTEDVRLARNGDPEAFVRLYTLVYKNLYRIALYNLRSPHDACDAVSDTVLEAYSTIGKLRDERAFRSWIMRILSAKIKRKQREYFADSVELAEVSDPGTEFDFGSIELREAVERLDPESKLILSMAVLEGYTSEETAKICGIKASTVRSKLSRIKRRLKLELT